MNKQTTVCLILVILSGAAAAGGAPAAFRFEESEGNYLKLFDGDKPVLVYNFGMILKDGVPERYRRSCYIHPVWGLDGEVLTDDFPRDHYHHRGIFWSWVRVEVEGKVYDPWAVNGCPARFEKWLERKTTPDAAVFGVQNGWYVDDRKVVDEKVFVTVHPADPFGRAMDLDLTFTAADKPVRIGGELPLKKGYGGFGIRFAPRVPVPAPPGQPKAKAATQRAAMTTPDGRQPDNVIGGVAPWADYSALFVDAKTTAGIAAFIHKSNPKFPNTWLLREYGYIGPTWPGIEWETLAPGKPLNLKYRVYVHRGDVKAGRVAEAYERYVNSGL
ncbi:MAG: PmoA family protein [Candidatus Sumerlaeia bacterium]|nr:PmoA family protein [Candidatus Sumerlaeia bacterium]